MARNSNSNNTHGGPTSTSSSMNMVNHNSNTTRRSSNSSNRSTDSTSTTSNTTSNHHHQQQQQERERSSTERVVRQGQGATQERAATTATRGILSILMYVGIGIIAGYAIFYGIWSKQCTHRMIIQQQQLLLQAGGDNATAMQQQVCSSSSSSSSSSSTSSIQELLQQQNKLQKRYEDLLMKHEMNIDKIDSLQKERDTAISTMLSLQNQINTIQRDTTMNTIQKQQYVQKEYEQLKNQLQWSQSLIQQKVMEVEELQLILQQNGILVKGSGSGKRSSSTITSQEQQPQDTSSSATAMITACEERAKYYEQEYYDIQSAIQRQNIAETIHQYGIGPYIVELTLDPKTIPVSIIKNNPNQDQNYTIQIVFPSIQEMPHGIRTFLHFIQWGLYIGTTLSIQDERTGNIMGGDPRNSIHKNIQSKLLRIYAEHGFVVTKPLFFQEVSTSTTTTTTFSSSSCSKKNRFGMIEYGPSFLLTKPSNMEDSSDDDDDHAAVVDGNNIIPICPGLVVHGLSLLVELRNHMSKKDRVAIINTTILSTPSSSLP